MTEPSYGPPTHMDSETVASFRAARQVGREISVAIPVGRDADDGAFEVGDGGCVYIVCQMCYGEDDWDREVSDLRQAALMWAAHVEAVHS